MSTVKFAVIVALSMSVLAGCGGGGGSSTPPVVAAPAPPPVSPVGTQLGGARQGIVLNPVGVVTTFAGPNNAACIANGGACPTGAANGVGNAARFYGAYGITTDGVSLFDTDNSGSTIRQTVIATGQVTTLAGTLSALGGNKDGTGAAAWFSLPTGITTDGTNLYITDSGNNNIRKVVIATGQVTTIAGPDNAVCAASPAGLCPKGTADGIGALARFANPAGITTDGTNLYVSDTGNCTIRKVVIATGQVTTLAGNAALALGFGGFADGVGTAAGFFGPRGITTDGTNLYVVDSGNHTVRKIVISTAQVSTIGGTAGMWGFADGIGAAAQFHNPAYVTTDGTNLFITDVGSFTIRKMNLASSQVTTVAGVVNGPGYADGTGATAQFNGFLSNGITTDGRNLYVADTANNNIRKIQ